MVEKGIAEVGVGGGFGGGSGVGCGCCCGRVFMVLLNNFINK